MSLFSVLRHLATPLPPHEHHDKLRAARTAHTAVCNGMAAKEVVFQVVGVSFKLQISIWGVIRLHCQKYNGLTQLWFTVSVIAPRGGGAGAKPRSKIQETK